MDITEGLSNITRIMLVLDVIAELYLMQDPKGYWSVVFHSDTENNVDFLLRWELYKKRARKIGRPSDLLVVQNALIDGVTDEEKQNEIEAMRTQEKIMEFVRFQTTNNKIPPQKKNRRYSTMRLMKENDGIRSTLIRFL